MKTNQEYAEKLWRDFEMMLDIGGVTLSTIARYRRIFMCGFKHGRRSMLRARDNQGRFKKSEESA